MALSQVKYLDAVPITTERVYEGLSLVTVELEGDRIPVKIDPVYGPQPYKVGGAEPGPHDSVRLPMMAGENAPSGTHKKWSECTSTEQQLAVYQAARMSQKRQEHAEELRARLQWAQQLAALKEQSDIYD
ncbi:unnamed protein product [Durusdinium trenchii]|uniref:Uncharacterized protein n=2 Tax=Durusdinium trenchii TaxID=1381693 RepID=A0ABP0MQL5_9DINO